MRYPDDLLHQFVVFINIDAIFIKLNVYNSNRRLNQSQVACIMIKLIYKSLFILALCTASVLAKAQTGYNYAQYDIGVAAGVNTAVMADVSTFRYTPSVHFNFNYNFTPYVNYVFEGQFGRLEGGDSVKSTIGRQFENHFVSVLFRGQLQAGEFLDYSTSPFMNVMKNWYVSTGIGYMVNHIVARSADKRGYDIPGDYNAQSPFIPARLGYEFKIFNDYNQPSVRIDLGMQYNFVFGDNVDGYSSATGKNNDAYAQFTIGVKFALGGVTSYRKQIQY